MSLADDTKRWVGVKLMHPNPRGIKVRTEHVFPPIPDRSMDWSAVDDDTYDGPGSLIGRGPTEQAAIDDLLQLIEEKS